MKSVNSLSLTLFLGLLVPGQVFGMFGSQRFRVVNGRKVPVGQTPGASSSKAATDATKILQGVRSKLNATVTEVQAWQDDADQGDLAARLLLNVGRAAEGFLEGFTGTEFGLFTNACDKVRRTLEADVVAIQTAFAKPDIRIADVKVQLRTLTGMNGFTQEEKTAINNFGNTLRDFVRTYRLAVDEDAKEEVIGDFEVCQAQIINCLETIRERFANDREDARLLREEARAAEEEARRTGRPAAAPARRL